MLRMSATNPWVLVLALATVLAAVAAWLVRRHYAKRLAAAEMGSQEDQRTIASARAMAQASADRHAVVEALVGEALVYLDANGLVAGASPAAMDWFDLSGPTALTDERRSTMAALRSADLAELADAGRDGRTEAHVVRIAGRTVLARAAPVPGGGVVLAMRDDTELERLARARRDLVTNVSHDLRTPLTSIGLMVEAVAADEQLAARSELLIRRIGEQLAVLNHLVAGMLDLDRLESGHAVFQLRPVMLAELVVGALGSVRPQIEQRAIRVQVDVPENLWVLADSPAVLRLLTNLLDNAARFSPAAGTILVGAEAGLADDHEVVIVSVADEGPGIPPADLERVFERFYRTDRSRAGTGAGLGLAIARHVTEGHGGSIRAANRTLGGTVITFTLPAAHAPA
jgi:two-component system phosphate regulon sensor histidine kinase PhoR